MAKKNGFFQQILNPQTELEKQKEIAGYQNSAKRLDDNSTRDKAIIDLLRDGDPKVYKEYLDLPAAIKNAAQNYEKLQSNELSERPTSSLSQNPYADKLKNEQEKAEAFRTALSAYPKMHKLFEKHLAEFQHERAGLSQFEKDIRAMQQELYKIPQRGSSEWDTTITQIMATHSKSEYEKHIDFSDYFAGRADWAAHHRNDPASSEEINHLKKCLTDSPDAKKMFMEQTEKFWQAAHIEIEAQFHHQGVDYIPGGSIPKNAKEMFPFDTDPNQKHTFQGYDNRSEQSQQFQIEIE